MISYLLTASSATQERNPNACRTKFDGWHRAFALVTLALLCLVGHQTGAASLSGSFTNAGKGWVFLPKTATNGGVLPRFVTNSTAGKPGWVEIGANPSTGTPGEKGAKATFTAQCPKRDGKTYCGITYTVDFTKVGNETGWVRVENKDKDSQDKKITASGTSTVTCQFPSTCDGRPLYITFWVDSPGGGNVSSTLKVTAVVEGCETAAYAMGATPNPFGEPRTPGMPLPASSGGLATLVANIQPGLSPIANPASTGGNSLDEVLVADEGSVLYKYNPLIDDFDNYYRMGGQWSPFGTLAPGEAAFIDSPDAQQFTFTGQYVPLPSMEHPSSGSAYFANPLPYEAWLEDVMGCSPVVGDFVVFFEHGGAHGWPARAVSTFMFQPDNFGLQPMIPAGETVQVFFAPPSSIPLSISQPTPTNVLVSAPGGFPESGLLQVADSLNSPWKSLLGVADFYSEPSLKGSHFFRLGFGVPTSPLFGILSATTGAPADGLTVQLGPNGPLQSIAADPNFYFDQVPQGLVDLVVSAPVQVLDPSLSQVTVYPVSLALTVPVTPSGASVALQEDFVAQVLKAPTCDCVPWCGVVGGTVNGVQKIVAGGGKLPPGCNGQATVIVTGPGDLTFNLGQGGRMSATPAANGTWTVTATVCGVTRTASITLP
jgi:hypothetical protein